MPLGETAQFRVVVRMTDGAARDLTEAADWLVSRQVALEGPGLVRGVTRGDADIGARVEGHHAGRELVVAPRGTYRLTGEVQETDSGPVVGAIVEVRRGIGAGLRTSTPLSGAFRLYGVADQITLRVTNPGYELVDQTIFVNDHQHVEIRLPLLKPRFDVSGAFTLTIAAAAVCAESAGAPLPEEARTRTYLANINQVGSNLEVSLDGATFAGASNQFPGARLARCRCLRSAVARGRRTICGRVGTIAGARSSSTEMLGSRPPPTVLRDTWRAESVSTTAI